MLELRCWTGSYDRGQGVMAWFHSETDIWEKDGTCSETQAPNLNHSSSQVVP